ncbi:MAG: MFS transporter [Candidatus Hodarchaeota archaeon]
METEKLKFTKKEKTYWSLAAISSAVPYQMFSAYIFYFYETVLNPGLPPIYVAIGLVIWSIWNAVNDPLLGYISDHTKTKEGRRIPYIKYGTIPFVIIFFLLWTPPGADLIVVFIYFLTMILLFDTLYTMVILGWTSLFPEMYKTHQERVEVTGMRQFFTLIGAILAYVVPSFLPNVDPVPWIIVGLFFTIITAFFLFISLKGSREDLTYQDEGALRFKETFTVSLSNKSFLTFVFTHLCIQYGQTLLTSAYPYYRDYALKIQPENLLGGIILLLVFVYAILTIPLWGNLGQKYGNRKCWILGLIISIFSLQAFWITKPLILLVIIFPLGLGLMSQLFFMDNIIADVVDEDELKTGLRRESTYFGMNAFVMRLAVALQALTLGITLQLTQGFEFVFGFPGNTIKLVLTGTTEFWITFIMAIPTAIALGIGILIMKYYPLHGDYLIDLKKRVKELHEKKGTE